jgi:chromosome segregation ATPase
MEEINLDLNNIFKLSYNFEGLKVLLSSIAKNQDMMMERIKKLESKPQIESMNLVNAPDNQKEIQTEENQINEKQNKEESNNSSKEEKDINNNFIISDLKNRILNIEKEFSNLRKFIPQYKESRTLNDILDEHKSNLNDLNENVKGINDNMSNMKENMENIKLKVMDFSVFDAFKDKNVTADIDAAELLIKSLENKINEKFKFMEDKMKIDEQDIMKLKTELTNIKNSSNFQTKNLTYVKEEIDSIQKSIEQLKTNTSDNIMQNRELIRKLREKNNSNSKDFSTQINSMKQKISSLEEKMQKMFEDIQNNIKKEENIDLSKIEQEFIKNDEFILFKDNIQKKCSHLEKKLQSLSENIKTEELEEKIYQINKELKNKKPDEKEFFSLSEQVQSHQDFFDAMKIENTNTQEDIKKLRETINLINRKCEDLILQNLMSTKMSEDSKDSKIRQNLIFAKLQDYLETSVFHDYLINDTREKEKIQKDIDNYKQFKEEMIETLKKSASIQDLKNLEDYLEDLIDEFKGKMFKLCPRKSEINKTIKSMELQLKELYEMISKKEEKNENWMLAKKPIGGFACASCESYLGDLKENDEKVFWNQFPEYNSTFRDSNVNKIGNGFSRILNLVNVNNKDKNEIDKGGKTLSSEETNSLREKKGKIDLKIFNETGYKKGKKNIFRNINIETNLKTMPSYDEVRSGFQTQRLNKMSIEEMKSKNSELNSNLPPITSRNDIMDIYEEGKEQKDAPKLIKIIKKKK